MTSPVELARVTDPDILPHIRGHLEEIASSSGLFTAVSLAADLVAGRKQLWAGASPTLGLEFVGLTEMVNHINGRTLDLIACVGEGRDRWMDKIEVVERFAVANGCRRIRAFSRPGWRRDLVRRGFRHSHDILEMDLG